MTGLNSGIDKFLYACLTIVLVSFTAVSLGTFISAASPSLSVGM